MDPELNAEQLAFNLCAVFNIGHLSLPEFLQTDLRPVAVEDEYIFVLQITGLIGPAVHPYISSELILSCVSHISQRGGA